MPPKVGKPKPPPGRKPDLAPLVRKLDDIWTMESGAKFALMTRVRLALQQLTDLVAQDLITSADDLTYKVESFALDQSNPAHRAAIDALRAALRAV